MEFYFLFPGLEKSWNLTPGFGKFIKVMEIITHPLAKLCCLVPLLNPAHQSTQGYWCLNFSMKIEVDFIFFITFCFNWLQIRHGMGCLALPPCLRMCHFMPQVMEKVIEFLASVIEKSWKSHGKFFAVQWIHPVITYYI